MRIAKLFKQFDLCTGSVMRCLTWFVISGLYLGSLHLPAAASVRPSALVFCPLQKTWVEKNAAPRVERESFLRNICAVGKRKKDFLAEISQNLRLLSSIADREQSESLFFRYAEGGRQALASASSAPNAPDPTFIHSPKSEKSVGGERINLAERKLEAFSLPQLPRPPTFQSVVNFPAPRSVKLTSVSRRIKPRAPPVFFS